MGRKVNKSVRRGITLTLVMMSNVFLFLVSGCQRGEDDPREDLDRMVFDAESEHDEILTFDSLDE